jgi:proteasome lid subunit RPN8/RPN11
VRRKPDVEKETRLRIGGGDLEEIRQHADAAWPRECCGVLVGVITAGATEVRRVVPTRNIHRDPERRYEIAPQALLRVVEEVRLENQEIVGYYHSHPNRPARPSATDEGSAWPEVSYLIVSTGPGGDGSVRSWRFDGSGKLKEERLMVESDPRLPVPEIARCSRSC